MQQFSSGSVKHDEVKTNARNAMRRVKNSITWAGLRTLALLVCFVATAVAADPHSTGLENIFAPESTPAKSIFDLSVFVLVITGIIFVVVFTLLVYSVVKFRGRAMDAGREPPQVYGST